MAEILTDAEREMAKNAKFTVKNLGILITSEMEKDVGQPLKIITDVLILNKGINSSTTQLMLLSALKHIVSESLKAIDPATTNKMEQIALRQSSIINEALEEIYQQFGINDANQILENMISQIKTDVEKS